jgi:hypothetical protein
MRCMHYVPKINALFRGHVPSACPCIAGLYTTVLQGFRCSLVLKGYFESFRSKITLVLIYAM